MPAVNPPLRLLLSLLPPLLAGLLQWLLWPLIAPYPWVLFFPTLFASAWIGGFWGGLAATALAIGLVNLVFVPTELGDLTEHPGAFFASMVLAGSGLLFSLFQRRLRGSLTRERELFQRASDGIFLADLSGRYIDVNAAGCRLLGFRREEIVGKTITDLIPPEDLPRLAPHRERLLGGQVEVGEWRLRRRDGGYLPVEVSATMLPDGRWLGFVRDISERRRLQQSLLESRADLERAQAVARIGSWRLDVVQGRLYWSDENYRIFGVPPGTPMDYDGFLACVHPEDRAYVDSHWQAALRGIPYDIEHRLLVFGEVRWVRERAELDRDPAGRVVGGIGITQDITERKRAEQALRESDERVRLLLESVAEGVLGVDNDGVCTFINPAGLSLLGYRTPDQLVGRRLHPLIHHTQADGSACPEETCRVYRAFREGRGYCVDEELFWRADGSSFVADYRSYPLRRNGRIEGAVLTFQDITSRRRAEEQLRQSSIVFQSTNEAIMITDRRGRVVAVNGAFTSITGFSAEQLLGRRPKALESARLDAGAYRQMRESLRRSGQWQGEIWHRRRNGESYPAWESVSAVVDKDGAVTHYVTVFSDISSIKASEERLTHLAHHDALTGLPNRLLFTARLEGALERARRHGHRVALLFLDLDRFKLINDTLGHAVGDRLLQEMARRLKGSVRAEDLVARLGGDEFTVILEGIDGADDAAHLARKLIDAVASPMAMDGREVVSSTSIGIGLFPDDADDADQLARAADAAMYRAKSRGRHTFEFHTPEITAAAVEHLAVEQGLRQAIAQDELELYFQRQIRLADDRLAGLEVLVRWNHPQRGLVMPNDFIPIAEESGLIEALGDWVLRRACHQAAAWLRAGLEPPRIAVNLSGRQLLYDHVVATVEEALGACADVAAGVHMELEITETVLQSSERSLPTLERLRSLGVGIAIDDFGTGYSSLSVLRQLPVDTLKIDQEFLRGVPDDPNNRAITAAIVSMGHDLGLRVVAEGVENREQLRFLRQQRCDEVQGFLFGEAVPAGIIERRLRVAAGEPTRH